MQVVGLVTPSSSLRDDARRALTVVVGVVVLLLATVVTHRAVVGLSVARPSVARSASTQAIPSGLHAAIVRRLGGAGLRESMTMDGGLHVADGTHRWSLVPTSLDRTGSRPAPLHGAAPVTTGGRTTYDMGALASWYRSSDAGIEQGFTIANRPAGSGSSFAITLRSMGTLHPVVTGSGMLALRSTDGRTVLTYGHLTVTDARGRILPARLSVVGHQVGIVVDDAAAAYPLTVDPLVQQAELVPGNASPSARVGYSVALSSSGTEALVGAENQAPNSQGAAYVFSGPNWSNSVELSAPSAGSNASFGSAVALSSSGTVALIGARTAAGGNGAAYVFTQSGSTWSQQAELTAADGAASDSFGDAVALSASGSTALIGAYGHSTHGAAYVFTQSGSTWSQAQEIVPSGLIGGTLFGYGVALSADGTIAAVGAPSQTVDGVGTGAAYLFGGTNWSTQLAELTPSGGVGGGEFGGAVALSASGATALIGASAGGVGNAYLFTGADWGTQLRLPSPGGEFGSSVALSSSGLTALVGAPEQNVGSTAEQGAVYAFAGPNWSLQSEGLAADGEASAYFGQAVAIDDEGNIMLVGAPFQGSVGSSYILSPPPPVGANSTIAATPTYIPANGTSTATVTVQAVDANGNDVTVGGATVALSTTEGSLGPVTDNGDGTYTATLTSTSSPGTATITGTINGVAIGHTATVTFTGGSTGYWTVAGDGGVFSFGPNFYGSTGNLKLNQPVFAITSTADGKGYWFVARDGGVFTYGDGVFHGSVPGLGIHVTNIVGMAADTATGGYWLVGSDGGVYAFDAPFDGSIPGLGQHVGNIVGIAATADGGGYYLVSSTGAVYAFGDATYQGGANTLAHLNAPIVGLSVDAATGGYWEAGSDGGVYAYGAPFEGSAGGTELNAPVVGIAATTSGSGYYLVASDGGVFSYNAPFLGSMGGKHLNAPMVGITVAG